MGEQHGKRQKIIACVDPSRFASPVADYAAWASRLTRAPLALLHVLDRHPERGFGDDHSGAIGIDAQESLAAKLVADEAARTAAAREQGSGQPGAARLDKPVILHTGVHAIGRGRTCAGRAATQPSCALMNPTCHSLSPRPAPGFRPMEAARFACMKGTP
jgi:hypothetical protein